MERLRRNQKTGEIEELQQYEQLFNRLYQEFESSGFDTSIIIPIQEQLLDAHQRRQWYFALPNWFTEDQALQQSFGYDVHPSIVKEWLQQLTTGEAPCLEVTEENHYQKLRHFEVPGDFYSEWRLFIEYTLQRIPPDAIVLRELLLKRVENTWNQQRQDSEFKNNTELVQQLGAALNAAGSRMVNEFFRELRTNQIIPPDRPRVLISESGQVFHTKKTSDGDYPFGTVKNGVLTWTAPIHQLARAIHEAEPHLGYDTMTAYSITQNIELSGAIVLKRGKFSSVTKYLEQIYRRDPQFGTEGYVSEAASMILSLLKGKPKQLQQ